MCYFSIGSCSDQERKRNATASHAHPIPTVLKHIYGVSSLATLNGGYRPAYKGKHTANANAAEETYTAKSERERILQTLRKRNTYASKDTHLKTPTTTSLPVVNMTLIADMAYNYHNSLQTHWGIRFSDILIYFSDTFPSVMTMQLCLHKDLFMK